MPNDIDRNASAQRRTSKLLAAMGIFVALGIIAYIILTLLVNRSVPANPDTHYTGTNGVSFSIADQSKYYGQALQAAVKNAEKSAAAIAQVYGKPLGAVKNVSEISRNYYYMNTDFNAKSSMMATEDAVADGGLGTTISYGKIEITANISVTYGL